MKHQNFVYRVGQWALILLVLGGFAALIGYACWQESWARKGKLDPRGGRYFFTRVELQVPLFQQADARWGADHLGATDGTLAAEGCAVTSAAMVFASYGIDTDPKRLNRLLQETGGYTPQGWIHWEKATQTAPYDTFHVYEGDASYELIDKNLAAGNPVIVRLRLPSGITHFVVIAGKDGFQYLIRDPGAGEERGFYPLWRLGADIEALRYYEKE
jgi:hypothetical protein